MTKNTTNGNKLTVYKNTSGIPLSIPELNVLIPAGGFSAPLTGTPSLEVFVSKGLLEVSKQELLDGAPNPGNSAVVGEPAPSTNNTTYTPAKPKDIVVGVPIVRHDAKTLVKNYEGKPGIADATKNTKVEIDGQISSVIVKGPKDNFANEIPTEDYIEDQAKDLLKQSRSARSDAATGIKPLPADAPQELTDWFGLNITQKKIKVYKSDDAAFLESLKNYENDGNILKCISEKLTEMAQSEAE